MSPLFEAIAAIVGRGVGLVIDIVHASALSDAEKQKLLAQVVEDVKVAHARAQAVAILDVPDPKPTVPGGG